MKKVVILATGGTIAGVGEPGKNTGYVSGQISAEDLVKSVPELSEYAEVTAEQICNVNSDDMTDKLWIKLSNRIKELQEDESVDAIVVTHGTDTMDETAYFISLTVKCEKAVVLTGSMKPATAKDPDGPANLLGAVRAAVGFAIDDDPPANLVWVFFAGELFDARSVQKCSASAINAMGVDAPGEGSNWNAVCLLRIGRPCDCGGGLGRIQPGLGQGSGTYRHSRGHCQPHPSRVGDPQRDACSWVYLCGQACSPEGGGAVKARPYGDGASGRYQAGVFAVS